MHFTCNWFAGLCDSFHNHPYLDYLFDRSGDLAIIYANPVHDYTDYVLEELGLGDPVDVIDREWSK